MAYIRFDLAQFLRHLLVQRYTRYCGVLHSTEAFFLPKLVIRTHSKCYTFTLMTKKAGTFLEFHRIFIVKEQTDKPYR